MQLDAPVYNDSSDGLYPRHVQATVREALADTPVVCLLGPRQCGKSTLAQMLEPDRSYVTLDEEAHHRLAERDPAGFIAGLPERVTIDEIQRAPLLLHEIKRAVDRHRVAGRFLLTGSANLLMLPSVSESLAGRMEIIRMHPLTEAECEDGAGDFLRAFLNGAFKPRIGRSVDDGMPIEDRLVRGGFPEPRTRSHRRVRRWHRSYLQAIIERDVRDVARLRNAHELARMLEMLALRTAQLLNVSTLAVDLALNRETVQHYLATLERLFLVQRLPAWHRNATRRLVRSPKIHIVDVGLAATLSDLTADDWFAQRDRMGHLLESFVLQQCMALATWTDPDLRFWHYRDKDQVEVDIVITRGRKVWGIEVKASSLVDGRDGRGLARLADACGRDFQGGIILHNGTDTLPTGDARVLAVPLRALWR